MATKQQLQIGRADDGVRITQEDFAEANFSEPYRYERAQGRLVIMAPSGEDHVESSRLFLKSLILYEAAHETRVARVVPEAWIVIDKDTDRIADIAVYLKSGRNRGVIPHVIPEIVFEVASEGYTSLRRDYEEKREDYWRAGVREFVIVDRFDHRVTVFRRGRGRYVEQVLGPDDIYTTPLLPGLKIALAKII
ncbi:MAG: Uma2 family endonuclease [Planctomycetaceae bacterium]|nr:Uma2 family endonuclease [Planctomycetaceae bacterium]